MISMRTAVVSMRQPRDNIVETGNGTNCKAPILLYLLFCTLCVFCLALNSLMLFIFVRNPGNADAAYEDVIGNLEDVTFGGFSKLDFRFQKTDSSNIFVSITFGGFSEINLT